jgi:hypothetical protein
MTSQINYSAIDATYPVAGQDNDSQGFRDNFAAIKTALQYAKSEITDVQTNGAIVNGANNFTGNQLYNAEFKYNSQTVYNIGTISGAVSVNFRNGQVQTLTTSGNITLSFTNWPTSTKSGSILLMVTLGSASHTITYPGTTSTPGLWKNPVRTGTYFLEFTTNDNGGTIYLNNRTGISYYSDNVQTLTGAGAVDLVNGITHIITTGANALTLTDGVQGQRKTIIMITDGGDGTLTPTNPGSFNTITFDNAGDSVELIFTNSKWYILGSRGITIA